MNKLDAVPIAIETILLFVYILFFFYQYFKNVENQYIYNEPCFWVVIGILLYLSGSFFLNILVNHLTKEQYLYVEYMAFIAEILKNILFSVAIVIYSRKPNENKTPKSIPYLDLTI